MNLRILLTAAAGICIVSGSWLFIDPSAAGILAILFFTLILSLWISADAARHLHPELFASLADDAQTIIVENMGTAPAVAVSVRLIPDDFRYEIGDLAPDTSHRQTLPGMIREGKAAVSWERRDKGRAEKFFSLCAYTTETDPLRPIFPLFNWKEKE